MISAVFILEFKFAILMNFARFVAFNIFFLCLGMSVVNIAD